MTKGVSIQCDSCETPYTPSVSERPIADGAVRLEHSCPACGAVYPIVEISETGIRLRERLNRLSRLGQMRTPQYQTILHRYRQQVRRLATTTQHSSGAEQ